MGRMRFRVRPGRYALVSLPASEADRADSFLPKVGEGFAHCVSEPGTATLLLLERRLPRSLRRWKGWRVQRGFRVISFETPMEWTVVGFLARVTGALAEAGVPVGVVCSFDFDHVFVPAGRLKEARRAIARALRPRGPRPVGLAGEPGEG